MWAEEGCEVGGVWGRGGVLLMKKGIVQLRMGQAQVLLNSVTAFI